MKDPRLIFPSLFEDEAPVPNARETRKAASVELLDGGCVLYTLPLPRRRQSTKCR
jgi:hypothetical protein